MAATQPKVGVVFTLLELYRTAHPDRPAALEALWRENVTGLLADDAALHFTGVAHTSDEVAAAVTDCESVDCDLLLVLPMAYAASGAARDALVRTGLPLVVVSTARDATLPHDMSGDHIMANHAMHGVQDLANVLTRAGRQFELIVGHASQEAFRRKLTDVVRASAGARVLRSGRVARIGKAFEGMLDFSYDAKKLAQLPAMAGGFEVVDVPPKRLSALSDEVSDDRVAEIVTWAAEQFEVDADLTDEELVKSARAALAYEDLVAAENLDAFSMNFLDVAAAGAETMPFLGAGRLMSTGVGYAGEGDVLTAALVAAAARIEPATTFTEMFCPDYERSEVLLSHMGECNFALANPAYPVKLVAKEFAYGDCARPAVPVFQLRPGTVTLVNVTEWPGEGLRIIASPAEVIDAPEHVNLSSPYTRVSFGRDLTEFLEDYSRAGGTHHSALAYGDCTEVFRRMAGLCGLGFRTV